MTQKAPHSFGVFLISLASIAVRTRLASSFDLSDLEAYNSACARHLADGGLDTPPLLPALMRIAEFIPTTPDVQVRIPSILFFCGVIALIHRIAGRILSGGTGFYAVVLLHLSPFFFFSGMMALPYALFFFFYLLLWRISLRDGGGTAWAFLAGLVFGLGFLAHPAMAAALISLALSAWIARPARAGAVLLGASLFTAGAAIPLAAALWAWGFDAASISRLCGLHMLGFGPGAFSWGLLLKGLAVQSGHMNPTITPVLAISAFSIFLCCAAYLKRRDWNGIGNALLWSLPLLIFANLDAGFRETLFFAPMAGYFGVILLLAYSMDKAMAFLREKSRVGFVLSANALLALLCLSAAAQGMAAFSVQPELLSKLRLNAIFQSEAISREDPGLSLCGWREFTRTWNVGKPADAAFLIGGNWRTSGHLEHGIRDPVLCFDAENSRGYGRWDVSRRFLGKTGYLIFSSADPVEFRALEPFFREISPWKSFSVSRGDKKNDLGFHVYRCMGLTRPLPHKEKNSIPL